MLQKTLLGAVLKRGWADPVHDPNLLLVDLHPLDERPNALTSRQPVRSLQPLGQPPRELLQSTDYQPQLRLRVLLVGPLLVLLLQLREPHQQRGHSTYLSRRLPAGETVEHLRPLLAHRRHERRALAPAAERLRHHLDRLRHPQPVASEVVSQFVEPHHGDLTDRARIHRLVSSWRGSEKGSGGTGASPEPSRPFLLSGQSNPYADVWPTTIRDNQLSGRDNGQSGVAVVPDAPAAATAAPARSLAATPDGKTGCRTAGTGSASRARSVLHTPDDRSKKIRNRRLGADPRAAAPGMNMRCPAPPCWPPGLRPHAGAPRSDTDNAGSGPGVSPDRCSSADTAGWPVSAATAAPPRGTQGYSIEPEGEWVGRASHTP